MNGSPPAAKQILNRPTFSEFRSRELKTRASGDSDDAVCFRIFRIVPFPSGQKRLWEPHEFKVVDRHTGCGRTRSRAGSGAKSGAAAVEPETTVGDGVPRGTEVSGDRRQGGT